MKKRITVKQIHRYSNERNVMYCGQCLWEHKKDCIKLSYEEQNKPSVVNVEVRCYQDSMELVRHGEVTSNLFFRQGEKTKGIISSIYGDIDIELYTYQYIQKDNAITLEYDILEGVEANNGYHIIWNIKEE